jgi:hypothetical protein
MTYVPVVVPPTQQASPRTRELAGLLGKVLEEYKKTHPAVTDAEVRMAFRLASSSVGSVKAAKIAVLVGVLSLVVATMVAGLFVGGGDGGGADSPIALSGVIAGLVVALGIVAIVKKRRS